MLLNPKQRSTKPVSLLRFRGFGLDMKNSGREIQDFCLYGSIDAHARQCPTNDTTRKPEKLGCLSVRSWKCFEAQIARPAELEELPLVAKPCSCVRMVWIHYLWERKPPRCLISSWLLSRIFAARESVVPGDLSLDYRFAFGRPVSICLCTETWSRPMYL